MAEEPSPAETANRRKGLLAFYVGTGVVILLVVGLYFAWTPMTKRLTFERRLAARQADIEMLDQPVSEVINFVRGLGDIDILVLNSADWMKKQGARRVTIKLEKPTLREVLRLALEQAGLESGVYGGNVLLIYDPASDAYRKSLAGGLRGVPGSSSLRNAMQGEFNFEYCGPPDSQLFNYLSSKTGLEHEAEWTGTEDSRLTRLRVKDSTIAGVWDLCLRYAGMIGEIRGDKVYMRPVVLEKQEAQK